MENDADEASIAELQRVEREFAAAMYLEPCTPYRSPERTRLCSRTQVQDPGRWRRPRAKRPRTDLR